MVIIQVFAVEFIGPRKGFRSKCTFDVAMIVLLYVVVYISLV